MWSLDIEVPTRIAPPGRGTHPAALYGHACPADLPRIVELAAEHAAFERAFPPAPDLAQRLPGPCAGTRRQTHREAGHQAGAGLGRARAHSCDQRQDESEAGRSTLGPQSHPQPPDDRPTPGRRPSRHYPLRSLALLTGARSYWWAATTIRRYGTGGSPRPPPGTPRPARSPRRVVTRPASATAARCPDSRKQPRGPAWARAVRVAPPLSRRPRRRAGVPEVAWSGTDSPGKRLEPLEEPKFLRAV